MSNDARRDAVWLEAAALCGWHWSAAHNGYISENVRRGPNWSDYAVASDPESACFISGVETYQQAVACLEKHNPLPW